MRRILVLAALAAAAGCGPEDDGRPAGPVTTPGLAAVSDSTAIVTNAACDPGGGMAIGVSVVGVTLADQGGLCALTQAGETVGGLHGVTFGVARMGFGAMAPIGRGEWNLSPQMTPPPPTAMSFDFPWAGASSLDGTCTATTDPAVSGTLWIDAVTATRVTGAIDAVLESGARISGAFDVAVCAYTLPIESACAMQTSPPATTCL